MAGGHIRMCCNKESVRFGDSVTDDDQCGGWEAPKSEDLEPCPFCGSGNVHFQDVTLAGFAVSAIVFCDDCGANMCVCSSSSRKECLKMWNRRAEKVTPTS